MSCQLIFIFSSIFILVSTRTLTGKFVMKLNDEDESKGFDIHFVDVNDENLYNTSDHGIAKSEVNTT